MTEQRRLRLYGQVSEHESLEWGWVDEQLTQAGTYWVVARTVGFPHPRPVWGIWRADRLFLSIGTPVTRRALAADPMVTVHLDSGTDVVIVQGRTAGFSAEEAVVAEYDRKYDWSYDAAEYGRLAVVSPSTIMAWRTAGWAGREGFQRSGRWNFQASG